MFDRNDARNALISAVVSGFVGCAGSLLGAQLWSAEKPPSPAPLANANKTYPMSTSFVFGPRVGSKDPMDLMLSPTGFDVYICQMTLDDNSEDFPDTFTRATIVPLAGDAVAKQFKQNAASYTDLENPISVKAKLICDANHETRKSLTEKRAARKKMEDEYLSAQKDFENCADKPVGSAKPKCVEEGRHLRASADARVGSDADLQKAYDEQMTANFQAHLRNFSLNFHYGSYDFSELPEP